MTDTEHLGIDQHVNSKLKTYSLVLLVVALGFGANIAFVGPMGDVQPMPRNGDKEDAPTEITAYNASQPLLPIGYSSLAVTSQTPLKVSAASSKNNSYLQDSKSPLPLQQSTSNLQKSTPAPAPAAAQSTKPAIDDKKSSEEIKEKKSRDVKVKDHKNKNDAG